MTPLLLRRLGFALLLAADIAYAAFLAPRGDPPGVSFWTLALGRGPARNPAVWAVFQLLGVVPLMYWALMIPDGRGQRVWAWPFALGLMALGSFALLPYLIGRRPYSRTVAGPTSPPVRWFGGRPFAVFACLALVGLLCYAAGWGDWADYAHWFRRSNFIHLMAVDFLLLTLLFPALLRDDMARRGVSDEEPLSRIALAVPLLGPAWYLLRRPAEMRP